MSDYERNKVIRYRPSEKALNYWKNLVKEDDSADLYEILSAVEDFFGKTFRDNSFEVTCTYDNIYIDILFLVSSETNFPICALLILFFVSSL